MREGKGILGFFFKSVHTHRLIDPQHAEICGLFSRPFNGSHDGVGIFIQKELIHIGVVHLVDMITSQD